MAAVEMVTAELGAHPTEIFAEWEAEPFAAANGVAMKMVNTSECGTEQVAFPVTVPPSAGRCRKKAHRAG